MTGKIIKILSNDFTVLSDNKEYICKARGKFRNMKVIPLVGDIVEFDKENNYIMNILPRKNYLIRPSVSNIDQLIIVASVKHPNFDSYLLDKLLVISDFNNIKPIICLSKVDLLTEEEFETIKKYIEYYQKIGYKVIINKDIDAVKEVVKGKINVFTGQSGAGKSTLLNSLDSNLNIKTNDISEALGRGKHTTRHIELLHVCDGWICDTPGFSSLEFIDMTKEDIRDNFIDFQNIRDKCKYKDCMHIKEDSCIVKDYVSKNKIIKSRYENYLKFIEEKKDK